MDLSAGTLMLLFGAMALFSAFQDHRHVRRKLRDRPGLIPWPLITICSLIVAAYCAAIWLGVSHPD